MRRWSILIAASLALSLVSCSSRSGVPHSTEEVTFQSGRFRVKGELRIPPGEGRHPLVIMVHGDGPAHRSYFFKLKETILRAGYATLMWDKPGHGKSTGKFSDENLRKERAQILVDAIAAMKTHPAVDAGRIGVWGISQAGYVIPLALSRTDDISFMILVGCAGENGINQTAYLIRRQLEFAGVSPVEAREAEDHFIRLFYAQTFEEYIIHAKPLYDNPVQRKLGFVSALWDEENWRPHHEGEEGFFDPLEIMEKTTIPALVFFGEKDTQVDPVQGARAYREALSRAGNGNFRVELIAGADHNIILCETGSMEERNRRSGKGWSNYAPAYLEIMEEWLKGLYR
ncbi:MAG: alpha/beta fold hydrolase [Candidatus Krumholzibacteriota bacterium]|nr:alpha/beta fold hydrolase [Candidatus Krumholzibacteriota bacterium]